MSRMDADLFRSFREKSNMRFDDLARALGISMRYLRSIEAGEKNPDNTLVEKLYELIAEREEKHPVSEGVFIPHGVAELKKELDAYCWRRRRRKPNTDRAKARRYASQHLRTVRKRGHYCLCPICSEARKTWCSIDPASPTFEHMTGGFCYWVPVVVWSCQRCAKRWAEEKAVYPEVCKFCKSPHWNGKTIERKTDGQPEDERGGIDLLHDGRAANGTPETRPVHQ